MKKTVYTAPSKFHGLGGFALSDLAQGEVITPAEEGFPRSGINSAYALEESNVEPVYAAEGFHFVAKRPIKRGEEILGFYPLPHDCTPETCPEQYLPLTLAQKSSRSLQ